MFRLDDKIDFQAKSNDILTVGELLIDMISTEYDISSESNTYQRYFGGSPSNIAMNTKKLGKDVVQRLLKLIKFRNEYDAFNGEFIVRDSKSDEIHLFWKKDDKQCALFIDLKTNKSIISYLNENGKGIQYLV
jgi:hypothetical protein